MTVVPFKYYLHDDASARERAQWISQQTGVEIDENLMEKIGRPFYEIGLDCTLDTQTGEVRVLGVSST